MGVSYVIRTMSAFEGRIPKADGIGKLNAGIRAIKCGKCAEAAGGVSRVARKPQLDRHPEQP
jgi:hypothetical protein